MNFSNRKSKGLYVAMPQEPRRFRASTQKIQAKFSIAHNNRNLRTTKMPAGLLYEKDKPQPLDII